MDAINNVIERIQANGERMTLPRRLVIDALGQAHHHQTIADIQQHIQAQSHGSVISDTTVYRVLQWLKELGLVSQTDLGKVGTVYALIDAPYHHHLICLTCGETFTISDDIIAPLRDQLRREYGFEARIDHMAIYGQCENCLKKV